jgi:RNA recognition motif-containing protein
VGNLSFDTSSQEIETLFTQAGEVSSVSVPTDRVSGRPRGFAFVEYANDEDATRAIERFDGQELGGRRLRVNEAGERPGPRAGGFGGRSFDAPPRPAPRSKGSRRHARARKRSIW